MSIYGYFPQFLNVFLAILKIKQLSTGYST